MIDFDSYSCGYESGSEDVKEKIHNLLDKWRKESKHREDIASEDWVSNILNECIEDLENIVDSLGGNND